MSQFTKFQNSILSKVFLIRRTGPVQCQLNYCQIPKSGREIIISRKKTYWSAALVGISGLAFAYYIKKEKDYAIMKERQKQLKKAGIGGKWELLDPLGNKRTTDDFKGKWCMIYFGFTHCPDICPDEMEKMTNVVKGLEKKDIDIQPIFITIDPERDTKEVVGKYVKEFSDKIVGLTGTIEEIKNVCHAFHVYFKAGPKDKTDDYIVDHTIILYLVDPNGEFIDYYGLGKDAEQIVASVIVNINKWKALNEKQNWVSKMINL